MNKIDSVWEDIHSSREWGQYPIEPVIRFVARNYYSRNRAGTKILDFGMGAGAHTWYLAREGFDTYGFDCAPSAVKRVQEKLEKENLTAHIQCCSGQDVNYPDSFFDAIIDSSCILCNCLDDIEAMYRKCFSMLKNSGKLLTICYGTKTTGYGIGEELEPGTYTKISEGKFKGLGTIHFTSKESVLNLLRKTGFGNIVCDTYTFTDFGSTVEQFVVSADK